MGTQEHESLKVLWQRLSDLFNAVLPISAALIAFVSGYLEGLPVTAVVILVMAAASIGCSLLACRRGPEGRSTWFLLGFFSSFVVFAIFVLNKEKIFLSNIEREIYNTIGELGGKIRGDRWRVAANGVASQTHFDGGAIILFFESQSNLYILLPNHKAFVFRATEVVVEKEWFDEKTVRRKLGVPPNRISPFGGVAKYWEQINKLVPGSSKLGWPDWSCMTEKFSVVSTVYDNGVIAGPFRSSGRDNEDNRGHWFAINSGSDEASLEWRSQQVQIDLGHKVADWNCRRSP